MFLRVECRDALKAAIEAATAVPVFKGFEVPNPPDERIHLDGTNGAVEYNVFNGSFLPHDDLFSIDVYVYTGTPGQTQDQAEARAQELMNAVDEAMRSADFDNADFTTSKARAWVIEATLATVDGPHTAPIGEGFEGFALLEVAVHNRSEYL